MNIHCRYSSGIFFILSMFICSHSIAGGYTIDVIHSDDYMITGAQDLILSGVEVNLFNLDDPARLIGGFKKSLSQSASLKQNKAIIMQRFNSMDKNELKKQFMTAYKGASLSMQHGVSRFPAILFNNGQSVIYGVTHLPTAVDIYNQSHNKGITK